MMTTLRFVWRAPAANAAGSPDVSAWECSCEPNQQQTATPNSIGRYASSVRRASVGDDIERETGLGARVGLVVCRWFATRTPRSATVLSAATAVHAPSSTIPVRDGSAVPGGIQVPVRAQHDLQMPRQIFSRTIRRCGPRARAHRRKSAAAANSCPRSCHRDISQEAHQLAREVCGTVASPISSSTSTRILSLELSATACITVSSAAAGAEPIRLRTESAVRWSAVEAIAGRGWKARRASIRRLLREQGEGVFVAECSLWRHVAQLPHDGVELHGAIAEVLAARADGLRNILGCVVPS